RSRRSVWSCSSSGRSPPWPTWPPPLATNESGRSQMQLLVHGADAEVEDRHATTPLLWVLRDVLGLHGTKFGCGAGYCAACTVLIDGRNRKSCQTATERALANTL